jgi:hypothetical protein
MNSKYTTQLGAGLGMIEETRILLNLWSDGLSVRELFESALESGEFPNMSARRLRNFVAECFAPRYLVNGGDPAAFLKKLIGTSLDPMVEQLMFIYTCRANLILADYVREVYWGAYSAGHNYISNEVARQFVVRAKDEGKTTTNWSESMVKRVSAYLNGCLSDFGLLEAGRKKDRKILPFRIRPEVVPILAYDLHLSAIADNHLLSHKDWMLFGMDRFDVVSEMKRLALQGFVLVQSVGDAIRIEWQYNTMQEVIDVLSKS